MVKKCFTMMSVRLWPCYPKTSDSWAKAGLPAHLMLTYAAPKRFHDVELDQALPFSLSIATRILNGTRLDQTVHMASAKELLPSPWAPTVQHLCELCDLLVLPIFTAFRSLGEEHRVRRRELHQALTRRRLHLEGRFFAAHQEGDEAHSPGDVVVRELHEQEACEVVPEDRKEHLGGAREAKKNMDHRLVIDLSSTCHRPFKSFKAKAKGAKGRAADL